MAQQAEDIFVSVNPLGIGLIVLVGTILGFMINYPIEQIIGFTVVGVVHGLVAGVAAWVIRYTYGYFVPRS